MPDVIVAGAGMAGLAAAARARELGASVVVREKGGHAGGAMLLSSGVIWRYRSFARFRSECPAGDPRLQRLVHDRLDGALDWLRSLGATVLARETGNDLTTGLRFDPEQLTRTLVAHAGRVELASPLEELPDDTPVVLATGGFQANVDLLEQYVTREAGCLVLRSTPWSTGDGLALALRAGGRMSEGLDEFYGRALPAPPARIGPRDFVPLSQVYARHAIVEGPTGERYVPVTWSEIDVAQWLARQPGARGRLRVPRSALDRVAAGGRTVAAMIEAAARAGADIVRSRSSIVVEVVAGITSTLGGIAVDETARAARGVYAAGGDVGGIATGGYASGLASALVLGRVAAESALEGR